LRRRTPVKIGVLHLRIKLSSKRSNVKKLQQLITSLMNKHRGEIDVLVLPQHPLTGPIIGYYGAERVNSHLRSAAERLQSAWRGGGYTINTLSKIASDYGVAVVGGPIVERAGPRLYFSMIYINSRGEVAGRYRKMTLSKAEERHAIGHGYDLGLFDVEGRLKVGVFADSDILNPEIFRGFQLMGANLLIGSLLPQEGGAIPLERTSYGILRPHRDFLHSLALTRALETGLPLILVGGIVEDSNSGSIIACSETLVVDPEAGILEAFKRGIDEPDSYVIVELDPVRSKPRECDKSCVVSVRALCRMRRASTKI
jgi:predicted amidohydrolase